MNAPADWRKIWRKTNSAARDGALVRYRIQSSNSAGQIQLLKHNLTRTLSVCIAYKNGFFCGIQLVNKGIKCEGTPSILYISSNNKVSVFVFGVSILYPQVSSSSEPPEISIRSSFRLDGLLFFEGALIVSRYCALFMVECSLGAVLVSVRKSRSP